MAVSVLTVDQFVGRGGSPPERQKEDSQVWHIAFTYTTKSEKLLYHRPFKSIINILFPNPYDKEHCQPHGIISQALPKAMTQNQQWEIESNVQCVPQANSLTQFVFQSLKIFEGRTSDVIQLICHHRNGFLRLS